MPRSADIWRTRCGGFHTALAGLNHHHHQIDAHGRAAAQVLDAGFHVEDHDLAVAQHQVRHQALQQHAFRAGAAAGGVLHRAQHQQVDALVMDRILLGNVGDFGIDLEHLAELAHLGSGALFDQLAFGGDGVDLGTEGGW